MRVLLIKTSSMGDLIHTLPALTDAGLAIPGITFDWMVEDHFKEIPAWHPLVDQVIPVALRRWRKGLLLGKTHDELRQLRARLRQQQYDVVLDAQGLIKSAFLTFFAKGVRAGLDFQSAREGLAALAYQQKYKVNFYQHAIVRMRSLFAQALHYSAPHHPPDFGLDRQAFQRKEMTENYLVFLHGTSWESKLWPEQYWVELAILAGRAGYRVKISGGNEVELARAESIASHTEVVDVLPRLNIANMASVLASAKAVIAMDTGLGHLAAALGVPTISLYGSTHPDYTGALGKSSIRLAADFPCAPCLKRVCTYKGQAEVRPACYQTISPARVWEAFMTHFNV